MGTCANVLCHLLKFPLLELQSIHTHISLLPLLATLLKGGGSTSGRHLSDGCREAGKLIKFLQDLEDQEGTLLSKIQEVSLASRVSRGFFFFVCIVTSRSPWLPACVCIGPFAVRVLNLQTCKRMSTTSEESTAISHFTF